MKRTCKQCGKDFTISGKEINFYKSKNLSLPKRCKECRDANKKGPKKQDKNDDLKGNNNKSGKKADTSQDNAAVYNNTVSENITNTGESSTTASTTSSKKNNKKLAVKVLPIAAAVLLAVNAGSAYLGNSDGTVATNNTANTAVVAESNVQISDVKGFRNKNLLEEHYEKHGVEMGFTSADSYEEAAKKVVCNSDSLHKVEAEDGDDVYYLEETNEFVIVSVDGYIRTYYNPQDGIAYFNRQ